MKAYSQDIRIRVVNAYQNREGSQRQLARRFKVSLSFVHALLKLYRLTGNTTPPKHTRASNPKVDENSLQLLLALADEFPALPLAQLCERLDRECQIRISRTTMWRILKKHRSERASVSSSRRAQDTLTSSQSVSRTSRSQIQDRLV